MIRFLNEWTSGTAYSNGGELNEASTVCKENVKLDRRHTQGSLVCSPQALARQGPGMIASVWPDRVILLYVSGLEITIE
jgi:hypothetical protein